MSSSVPDRNQVLFERAQRVIPGGVNSPVRAFRAVGGTPRFIDRAQGPYMWDAAGQRYIDYIGSWGPMILGHGHPEVLEAVQRAAVEGFSFGAPTEREIELAEAIVAEVPSIEQVRLVSSGTEAGMSAIRLARGATGRSMIIKFEGCYHGHADALLVKAGSGLATFGHPTSAGVPPEVAQHTLVLEYNNVEQIEAAFAQHGDRIACVMIEPIAGNMNFVRAQVPFVARIRELCDRHGALFVFDEVMTGFRVALGSAQSLYAQAIPGFRPDISVFGKVIGGGMPLAAFGTTREVMKHLAPLGGVYRHAVGQSGGHRLRSGHAAPDPPARLLRGAGRQDAHAGRRPGRGRTGGRRALRHRQPGRHVRLLLPAGAAAALPGGDDERQRTLQPLLPRPAGPRRLPGPGALRGRLRQRRPHRRRHRRDHRGRARGDAHPVSRPPSAAPVHGRIAQPLHLTVRTRILHP
jgi:glutamate-1-semialdehyde-2,1-aminomutase